MKNGTKILTGLAMGALLVSSSLPLHKANAASEDTTLRLTFYGASQPKIAPGEVGVIQHNTQEGLVRNNPDDQSGGVVPGIASSWDISQDGKVYTFHLRDAKWSDGSNINAADFVYGWNRLKQTQDSSFVDTFQIQDMSVVDAKTVQVTFAHPGDQLIRELGNDLFVPIKQSYTESKGQDFGARLDTTLYDGPYIVKEVVPGDHVVLEKNPQYWDAGHVTIQDVVLSINMDATTAARLFQNGQLDQAGIAYSHGPFFKSEEKKHYEPAQTSYLILQSKSGPLTNKHIRKALELSLDRDGYGDMALYGMVPRGISGDKDQFRNEQPITNDYNLGQARTELQTGLQQLGLTELPPIQLDVQNGDSANYFPAIWKEALGIDVRVQSMSFTDLHNRFDSGQSQIGKETWLADFNDPSDFLDFLHSSNGYYKNMWSNTSFDSLIDAAKQITDRSARIQKLHEAEKVLLDDASIIPLYQLPVDYLVQPYVTLAVTAWNGQMDFKNSQKSARPYQSLQAFHDQGAIMDHARDSVEKLLNMGIINGTGQGQFDPMATVTREQFVKMIVKGMGLGTENANVLFEDMDGGMWSYPYVQTAVAHGIIHGIDDNNRHLFKPNDPITRAQMATILKNALQLSSISSTDGFSDIQGHWAAGDIMSVKAAGLIKGVGDNRFEPEEFTSRQDAAVVIDRMLSKMSLPPVVTP